MKVSTFVEMLISRFPNSSLRGTYEESEFDVLGGIFTAYGTGNKWHNGSIFCIYESMYKRKYPKQPYEFSGIVSIKPIRHFYPNTPFNFESLIMQDDFKINKDWLRAAKRYFTEYLRRLRLPTEPKEEISEDMKKMLLSYGMTPQYITEPTKEEIKCWEDRIQAILQRLETF